MCIRKLSKDPSRGKQGQNTPSPLSPILISPAAVAFHFSHVGDDEYGRDRLRNMAASDSIGEYVDCKAQIYWPSR